MRLVGADREDDSLSVFLFGPDQRVLLLFHQTLPRQRFIHKSATDSAEPPWKMQKISTQSAQALPWRPVLPEHMVRFVRCWAVTVRALVKSAGWCWPLSTPEGVTGQQNRNIGTSVNMAASDITNQETNTSIIQKWYNINVYSAFVCKKKWVHSKIYVLEYHLWLF